MLARGLVILGPLGSHEVVPSSRIGTIGERPCWLGFFACRDIYHSWCGRRVGWDFSLVETFTNLGADGELAVDAQRAGQTELAGS